MGGWLVMAAGEDGRLRIALVEHWTQVGRGQNLRATLEDTARGSSGDSPVDKALGTFVSICSTPWPASGMRERRPDAVVSDRRRLWWVCGLADLTV
jgi:hypothetical protein